MRNEIDVVLTDQTGCQFRFRGEVDLVGHSEAVCELPPGRHLLAAIIGCLPWRQRKAILHRVQVRFSKFLAHGELPKPPVSTMLQVDELLHALKRPIRQRGPVQQSLPFAAGLTS